MLLNVKASIRLALYSSYCVGVHNMKIKRGVNNESQIFDRFSKCDHTTINIVLSIAVGGPKCNR